MSRNQKLTPLLAGRALAAVEPPTARAAPPAGAFTPSPASTWHLRFADGSTLAVRTDGTPPEGPEDVSRYTISDVTQRGTTLTLSLKPAGGEEQEQQTKTLTLHTAEPTACVMLRDPSGKMEYAD